MSNTRYFIAFPVEEKEFEHTLELIASLRLSPDSKAYRTDLIKLIMDLAEQGIGYFFLESLRRAGINSLKVKTAEFALQGFKLTLNPMLRSFIMGMDDEHLLKVLEFVEGVMVVSEEK